MVFMPFFSEFLYKSICCGYSFELHRQVDAIQMGTHSICLYKEVAKQYTSCNPKSTELFDCALIGVCAVIRSNTVCFMEKKQNKTFWWKKSLIWSYAYMLLLPLFIGGSESPSKMGNDTRITS